MKLYYSLHIIILFLGSFCCSLYGQTTVSGTLNVSTTWTLAESPFVVSSNFTVAENVTLSIEPGVVIKFSNQRNSFFTVNGTLDAQGTAAQPIIFTSYQDDSAGGDTNGDGSTNPSAGDWRSITFNESSGSSSVMDHCEIRYGGYDNFDVTRAMNIFHSSPTISNCHFYRNSHSMRIGGLTAAPMISNNTFEEDTWAPISLDLGATPIFSGNQYSNNNYDAVGITSIAYNEDNYTLPKLDVAGFTNIPYIHLHNITIGDQSTLTIEPGVVIKATSERNSLWTRMKNVHGSGNIKIIMASISNFGIVHHRGTPTTFIKRY